MRVEEHNPSRGFMGRDETSGREGSPCNLCLFESNIEQHVDHFLGLQKYACSFFDHPRMVSEKVRDN
jgi:hypothetical protein